MALIGNFMNLILTMAGHYKRFLQEGYKIPKYLLPWGGKTVLSAILAELNKDQIFKNIFLVANNRDEAYLPHVRAVMRDEGILSSNLIVTGDTSGQVETAMIGVRVLESIIGEDSSPIFFHNIDTILLSRDLNVARDALYTKTGFIDVFNANNKNYSYVLAGPAGEVTDIAEKIVISNLATSGLYGFNNIETINKYFSPQDLFISSIYKKMIDDGCEVAVSNEHQESDTIVLGTPFEYMNASSTMLDSLEMLKYT
jgi:NDP-sugar pyrophosphorylase family protein